MGADKFPYSPRFSPNSEVSVAEGLWVLRRAAGFWPAPNQPRRVLGGPQPPLCLPCPHRAAK